MPANTVKHTRISVWLIARLLLPDTDSLQLDEIIIDSEGVAITATSCQTEVQCPNCRQVSGRKHSRHTMRPTDLPIAGRRLRLQLHVHRFFL